MKKVQDSLRKQQMKKLRRMKYKLREIGAIYGMSGERVRQIIGNTGGIYEQIKLRRPELIAVKEYLRLRNAQLAKLYYVYGELIGRMDIPGYYTPGFRKCYGDCKQVLPEDNFYTPKCKRCKPCSRLQQNRNYRKYGTYHKHLTKGV